MPRPSTSSDGSGVVETSAFCEVVGRSWLLALHHGVSMIPPLIQQATIDVTRWEQDEFVVFPQGARAKSAYLSPDAPPDPVIRPRWRYLFKKSRGCYPEQFWGEVVAYRIGCLMGVPVPSAFAAVHWDTGVTGALIEWFYEEGVQNFIWAGEFLQGMTPNFDRELGSMHCIQGGFKSEVQHLPTCKVRRCQPLPRTTTNCSLKTASPLPA